ncbi:hypothetical protein [Streptomyces sp. NPDC058964]|uniref:hypothetical protein n=1 Tax=Streptomyces sp. NPDC058964 TaxID=3346681 RepID=UPI003698D762
MNAEAAWTATRRVGAGLVRLRPASGPGRLSGRRPAGLAGRRPVGDELLPVGDRPDLALGDGDGTSVFRTVVPASTPPYSRARTSARLNGRSRPFGTTKTPTSDGRTPQADTRSTARFTAIRQQEGLPYTIKSVTGP